MRLVEFWISPGPESNLGGQQKHRGLHDRGMHLSDRGSPGTAPDTHESVLIRSREGGRIGVRDNQQGHPLGRWAMRPHLDPCQNCFAGPRCLWSEARTTGISEVGHRRTRVSLYSIQLPAVYAYRESTTQFLQSGPRHSIDAQ